MLTNISEAIQRFDKHLQKIFFIYNEYDFTPLNSTITLLNELQAIIKWENDKIKLDNKIIQVRNHLISYLLYREPNGFEFTTQHQPIGEVYDGNHRTNCGDSLYETLILLAKMHPLNEDDPISLDSINDENKFFSTTGHQYDIEKLANWFRTRKALINPLQGIQFHKRDMWEILKLCIRKGKDYYFYYTDYIYDDEIVEISNLKKDDSVIMTALTLMKQQKVMKEVAFLFAHTATKFQIYGIEQGLFIEDIIEITEPAQIQALVLLKAHGLTNKAFVNKAWFTSMAYAPALKKLVCDTTFAKSFDEAFEILKDFTQLQAQGVVEGFSCEEVTKLTTDELTVLIDLHSYGLQIKDVENQTWCSSKQHTAAFKALIGAAYISEQDRLYKSIYLGKQIAFEIALEVISTSSAEDINDVMRNRKSISELIVSSSQLSMKL